MPQSKLEQAIEAGSCVAQTITNLTALFLKDPYNLIQSLNITTDWFFKYVVTQQRVNRPRRFIYTKQDHQIPFDPTQDINYMRIVPNLTTIGRKLIENGAELEQMVQGLAKINAYSGEVFIKHPTIMPRFKDKSRIVLTYLVQLCDRKPTNCCPSLHIAYATYAYNLAQKMLNEKAIEPVKQTTAKMTEYVLKTKQHVLIDVSFGMLCAKKAYEETFKEELHCPKTPYGKIKEVYDWGAQELNKGKTLAETINEYFTQNNIPIVPENYNYNWDENEKEMREMMR